MRRSAPMSSPTNLHCDSPTIPPRCTKRCWRCARLKRNAPCAVVWKIQNERLRHFIRQLQRMPGSEGAGEARPRPAGARARGSRAGGGGSGRRSGEGGSAAAPGARPRAAAEPRRPARTHLPRIEVVIQAADDHLPCCSGPMHLIGEDRSKRLDVIPMRYQVIVTRRPKYGCRACPECGGAGAGTAATGRGGHLPAERMVAQVLVTKYADHAPLYRQARDARSSGHCHRPLDAGLLGGHGSGGAESRCSGCCARSCWSSARLFVDETTAPVLDRAAAGQDRVLLGDRPRRPAVGRHRSAAVVYSYAPKRPRQRARGKATEELPHGILQADAYVVYKKVAEPPGTDGAADDGVILAHCWAPLPPPPVLRDRAQAAGADRPRSAAADRGALRDRGGDPPAGCRRAPGGSTVANKAALGRDAALSSSALAELPRKSPLAEAIGYPLNHWEGSPASSTTAGSRSTPARGRTLDQADCSQS